MMAKPVNAMSRWPSVKEHQIQSSNKYRHCISLELYLWAFLCTQISLIIKGSMLQGLWQWMSISKSKYSPRYSTSLYTSAGAISLSSTIQQWGHGYHVIMSTFAWVSLKPRQWASLRNNFLRCCETAMTSFFTRSGEELSQLAFVGNFSSEHSTTNFNYNYWKTSVAFLDVTASSTGG